MYRKVLVPLTISDGPSEEGPDFLSNALASLSADIGPDSEIVLLAVTPKQEQEGDAERPSRSDAMDYLHHVIRRVGGDAERWTCEVIEYGSVLDGIIDFASDESVDLVVLCERGQVGADGLTSEQAAWAIQASTSARVWVLGTSGMACAA